VSRGQFSRIVVEINEHGCGFTGLFIVGRLRAIVVPIGNRECRFRCKVYERKTLGAGQRGDQGQPGLSVCPIAMHKRPDCRQRIVPLNS